MFRLTAGILIALTTASTVIPRYFASGFAHILPDGVDHMLFILGLFFLSKEFSVLLFQLTIFTLAHSLTLALSLYGFISVPETFVEVAIALSISFIAIENLLVKDRLRAWRPWVVFGFGLIHGLGFAHSFAATPLDPPEFLPAIFSFNMGIECGQLAVIGLAYAATISWWERDWYPGLVARPACMAIAATGLFMAVQRGVS
jgi:hypothetical protein